MQLPLAERKKTMAPDLREQARTIHETVHALKSRFVARCSKGSPGPPDVTVPQMHCLMAIRERGSISIKDLAQALLISPPSASAMVDRLVEVGAVVREQSPVDRRGVVVSVSEEGAQAIESVEGMILQGIEELIVKIGPEHAQMWYEAYKRIAEVLREDDTLISGEASEHGKGDTR